MSLFQQISLLFIALFSLVARFVRFFLPVLMVAGAIYYFNQKLEREIRAVRQETTEAHDKLAKSISATLAGLPVQEKK